MEPAVGGPGLNPETGASKAPLSRRGFERNAVCQGMGRR
jgi:hypothetical protein